MKTKYKDWTLIQWWGNPSLGYECYIKSFGRGHVSVGVGEFNNIVFSHGANSDESMSDTRWTEDGIISEAEAMIWVDSMGGYHNNTPKRL